jgi:hypothetical protein
MAFTSTLGSLGLGFGRKLGIRLFHSLLPLTHLGDLAITVLLVPGTMTP